MKFVFYLISEWPSTTTPKCKNSSDDIFNIDAEEEMTERLFDERSEEDLLKLIDENSICESWILGYLRPHRRKFIETKRKRYGFIITRLFQQHKMESCPS
ncbi:18385_t:CDS:2 [Entrophospora sp. SA101]|nr:18385_t:CDS:2 [Entrophospora sp. SA101]